MEALLGVETFDLSRALKIDPEFLNETAHEHDETVASVALVESGTWICKVKRLDRLFATNQGTDIFRMKGIVNIAGEDNRFVFQGVHMLFDGTRDRPGSQTKLVK